MRMANMFSKACKYAIKATTFIAQNGSVDSCMRVKQIAEGINAPEHFIAKILQELNKKRFIISVKGPNGGFYMTEKQRNVSVERIVIEFDGDEILADCILGLEECSSKNPCPMHGEYQKIREEIKDMLGKNTIADFNDLVYLNKAVLKIKKGK